MSRKEKLLERLKNSPNNCTFDDLRLMLEEEGFELDRVSGSHHIFKKSDVIFVIPVHKNRVKSVYVEPLL
jgi:predicted RNA binding protein YcfA (HicA-like mRNA interferase family)